MNSNRGVLGYGQRGGGVDRPNPGEGVVGGEGKEAWELKGSRPHLLVLGIVVGVSCSGGATQAGEVLGEEKLPVSCAGVRRSDW